MSPDLSKLSTALGNDAPYSEKMNLGVPSIVFWPISGSREAGTHRTSSQEGDGDVHEGKVSPVSYLG